MINRFRGKYYFLSNFYESDIEFDGITYHNNEAAFQAQKVIDERIKLKFAKLKAHDAKKLGRRVKLRNDWEDVKDSYMYKICKAKFSQNSELRHKLLKTGEKELVEGNPWHDTYWGICNGKGKNKLGKILMKVREELKGQ